MSNVTYVTCHMSHMLHVTNIKLQRTLPKTQCVIYFWKSHAISMANGHDKNVACGICYMSHVTHVTCHKYKVAIFHSLAVQQQGCVTDAHLGGGAGDI